MIRFTLLFLFCFITLGCSLSSSGPQHGLSLTQVDLKGESFSVEVAKTATEHRKGLQYRTELSPNSGMLFVYDQPRELHFWMKDTLIGLDILFFDDQRHFLNAHYNVPPCKLSPCPNYPSEGKAGYVLELSSGVGQSLDLKKGDALTVKGLEL